MEADQNNACHKTAIYLRLSKDDDDKSESASIATQRSILRDFAKANDFTIADEYIDASDIIGLKQNPTNGRRFSPIFSFSAI